MARRLDGAQIWGLAQQFGVDRATVENHLRRQAVPKQPDQGRTLDPEKLAEAGQLYVSGLSLVAVGQQVGFDKRYLAKALPTVGARIRPPGRQAAR